MSAFFSSLARSNVSLSIVCRRSLHTTPKFTPLTRPSRVQSSLTKRWYSAECDRAALGIFTPTSAGVFVAVGLGMFFYFRYEKEKLMREREKERESRSYGRASIGGPFVLDAVTPDANGKATPTPFADTDMLGKWNLVYFGFTNCPDICPAEMDKMGEVLNVLEKDYGKGVFQPIFVTVDPVRDAPSRIAQYLADFHPTFIGLFGSYAQTKALCKLYRVYFSTPADAKEDGDYLVDHSIFIYLMDPKGQFVEAFGQSTEAETAIARTKKEVDEWKDIYGKLT